jgi:mannose-6-phosphate isomerase
VQPVIVEPNLPDTFYRGSGRLARFRGADLPPRPEDWVASTTSRFGSAPSGLTTLADGTLLRDAIAADPDAWLGQAHAARFGADTALLVKLLDAGQRLPVHVHPGRAFAHEHLASPYGKTEAWIILDAAPDATVHLGFRRDVARAELTQWVAAQDVAALLDVTNTVPVAAGDALLCPAGTPHAIGADVLLVELQEPTDFSVLLEWEGFAAGPDTAMLGLPLDLAMDCVDRRACSPQRLAELRGSAETLLPAEADDYFSATRAGDGAEFAGFGILVVTAGAGELTGAWGSMPVARGTTVAVPFGAGVCRLTGRVEAIHCRPPATIDR